MADINITQEEADKLMATQEGRRPEGMDFPRPRGPHHRSAYDGAPHRNPDGQEIPCPHLHVYRQEWLENSEVRYTPKVKFTGISGFNHLFHFVIPKSPKKQKPERIAQAVTNPTRDSAEAFIYAWSDTREVRPADAKAYAVLNDTEQQVWSGVLEAFRNYRIQPVLFTRRGDVALELAA